MSRKLTAATLALTLAGGVYLTAGPVQASNMGFKLERSFAVVRENPADRFTAFQNIYMLSFPLFNGLGDIGSSSVVSDNCAAGPDGIVDSVDAICDLFTDRSTQGNSFGFLRFNRDTCLFEGQTASFSPLFGLRLSGTAFVLERDAGFWITVGATDINPPANRAVVVGSHDPSYTGRQIRVPASACVPKIDLINLPYHSMYQKANEVLCGLEGVDWVDVAPADGKPDTCPRGIFDGNALIQVLTFDNVNDDTPSDNGFAARQVVLSPLFGLQFQGPNFDLIPGDAYEVAMVPTHVTTTFISPHF
jgi:hypothetical protein